MTTMRVLLLVLSAALLTGCHEPSPETTETSAWRAIVYGALIPLDATTDEHLVPGMHTGTALTRNHDSVDLIVVWTATRAVDTVAVGILYAGELSVVRVPYDSAMRRLTWRKPVPQRGGVASYTACMVLRRDALYGPAVCTPSAFVARQSDGRILIYDADPPTPTPPDSSTARRA